MFYFTIDYFEVLLMIISLIDLNYCFQIMCFFLICLRIYTCIT